MKFLVISLFRTVISRGGVRTVRCVHTHVMRDTKNTSAFLGYHAAVQVPGYQLGEGHLWQLMNFVYVSSAIATPHL